MRPILMWYVSWECGLIYLLQCVLERKGLPLGVHVTIVKLHFIANYSACNWEKPSSKRYYCSVAISGSPVLQSYNHSCPVCCREHVKHCPILSTSLSWTSRTSKRESGVYTSYLCGYPCLSAIPFSKPMLTLLARYEVKIAKNCNFWTFRLVVQLI